MKEIIDDLKNDGFTLIDYVMSSIGTIIFILIIGIAGAIE